MEIRPFLSGDNDDVIRLWRDCGLVRPWNDPQRDIERKLTEQPELFLVGVVDGVIVASAMFGFDGTRGWVHYLGVAPSMRGRSLGRLIMAEGERLLVERGCPKLNLQVRADNDAVLGFYRALGYEQDAVVSLGKRLIPDR
ncbi:MAG: ypeA [Microbacteriaceae bacterium]|nr:ypeA [Microbacteriaceae bacterium]